jgi:hypothetical protein
VKTIFGLILLGLAHSAHSEECPAKISGKFCAQYLGASDSDYLKVRIVLNGAGEAVVPKGEKRPLRIWTEDMIAKYDPRNYSNIDSAYVPRYNEGDFSPSLESVMYHNVSMLKVNLRNLASESYLSAIEPGCAAALSTGLCTEMNGKPDSSAVLILIILQDRFYGDSTTLKDFYSRYDFKSFPDRNMDLNPSDMVRQPYTGVYASITVVNNVSSDRDVRFIEQWTMRGPAWIKAAGKKKVRNPTESATRAHRADGRAIHVDARRPRHENVYVER